MFARFFKNRFHELPNRLARVCVDVVNFGDVASAFYGHAVC